MTFFLFPSGFGSAISNHMVEQEWTNLSPRVRKALLEVVERLLHDWIKYMEMRLTSIDWFDPPSDLPRMLEVAILKTRRFGHDSKSVADLWKAGKQELLRLGSHQLDELIGALDDDVAALEALLSWPLERFQSEAEGVEIMVRHPGSRLRALKESLLDIPLYYNQI